MYIGIDPGGTIGLAVVWAENLSHVQLNKWAQVVEPAQMYRFIEAYQGMICETTILVEDCIGAGARSNGIKRTIELLGFVKYYYGFVLGFPVKIRTPQRRIAFQERAAMLIEDKSQKHAIAALAHVLSYLKEVGTNEES